jgi:hypothetical protein
MSAMRRTVRDMVNPSVMQQLASEYRREDLEAARIGGAGLQPSHRSVRERLGWSLVSLGVRLTRDPLAGGSGYGRHVQRSQRSGARPARNSLPLVRL